MEISKTMHQQNSEKEPTFLDIAACFSKEEWSLLYEWQKEIYRNIMKEIHEALSSLGPRIASSVFSLRACADGDLGVQNHHGFVKKPDINTSATCFPDISPDLSHQIKCEANRNSPDKSDVRDIETTISSCKEEEGISYSEPEVLAMQMSEEEQALCAQEDLGESSEELEFDSSTARFAILNTDTAWKMGKELDTFRRDYCNEERADACNSASSDSGYGVVKFTIKTEDQHPMDHQEFEMRESTDYLAGFETKEGAIQEEDSIIFKKRKTGLTASPRKTNYLQCSAKGEDARNAVCQESNLEGQTKDATKCERELHQDTLLITGSGKTSAPDSNLWNTTFFKLPSNTEQTHGADTLTTLTIQETHTREKLYHCPECEKRFSLKRHLIIHQRSHKEQREQPFYCIQCQKCFSEKCNLVIHMRTHTGERPFECPQCDKRFSIKSNLVKHQRLHSRVRLAREADGRNSLFEVSDLEGQTKAATRQASDLHQDIILIEGSEKTSAPESIPWNAALFTLPLNTQQTHEPYTCTELTGHIETHGKDKPYHCAECDKQFSFKRNVIRHQRTHKEQREWPFQCTQCQKNFTEKSNLVIHMRKHTGERPFQCTECEKRFSIKANLVTHQRLHSRERPYQCSECKKSFNQKNQLRSHMTKHT